MEAAAREHPRSARQAVARVGAASVRFGVEHPAHYRLMFGPSWLTRSRYPASGRPATRPLGVLTGVLERGQASGQVRRDPVLDQALAAWSLVHGLPLS